MPGCIFYIYIKLPYSSAISPIKFPLLLNDIFRLNYLPNVIVFY